MLWNLGGYHRFANPSAEVGWAYNLHAAGQEHSVQITQMRLAELVNNTAEAEYRAITRLRLAGLSHQSA